MNRGLTRKLCAQEVRDLQDLLWGGPRRTFGVSFYEALEREVLTWAAQLINRAAMFARSREFAIRGEIVAPGTVVAICDADVNNAWDLLVQEGAEK